LQKYEIVFILPNVSSKNNKKRKNKERKIGRISKNIKANRYNRGRKKCRLRPERLAANLRYGVSALCMMLYKLYTTNYA
jgi:hypothetical protein